MTRVKICGLTTLDDAAFSVDAGADAIGLNFWPRSARYVSADVARAIVSQLPSHVISVGVFVDASAEEIERLQGEVGFRCVQLHGDESPALLERFLPHAYKALRVRGRSVFAEAARFGGEHILLDAYVPGEPGGTGETFDWGLASQLSAQRKVTLAGGLTAENVAEAVAAVAPFCVDVASGVERAPGRKDHEKVRAFIARAKGE